ncbi:F0F1 ATP synthase subunit epsilon [Albimonas sp. CAU 1670]|uniref:F0F1 ATP synthase subunit epsilon n=1 Tax=Albimonas sp. CAU 1670 TaxID=3032599 RepID=UPI0023DCA78C|nr:F0F1 ATP synthase subunit epsilon [Albimonas sp. CAU 1670]MDF2235460.1 F0F1 ATP synthase subunit epsilon [Albimonas sp. CAU 1670]
MKTLHLTVATPLEVAVDAPDVASVRAEDASGGFGIQPGHADYLTAMEACVLRWRPAAGPWRYAALRGGVLSVEAGSRVRVACREAILGDDLATLEAQVAAARADAAEASRAARAQHVRRHAQAVREIMRRMGQGGYDERALAQVFE